MGVFSDQDASLIAIGYWEADRGGSLLKATGNLYQEPKLENVPQNGACKKSKRASCYICGVKEGDARKLYFFLWGNNFSYGIEDSTQLPKKLGSSGSLGQLIVGLEREGLRKQALLICAKARRIKGDFAVWEGKEKFKGRDLSRREIDGVLKLIRSFTS